MTNIPQLLEWDNFEKGNICVGFYNEECYVAFLKDCEKRGYKWVNDKLPTEDCFGFTLDRLVYCCGSKKLALGTEEQRLYKPKVVATPFYTLDTLINEHMVGAYENDSYTVTIEPKGGEIFVESKGENTVRIKASDIFSPVENKIVFDEALKAYNEGKTIRSLKTFRTFNILDAHKYQGDIVRFSEINGFWEIL